MKTEMHKALTKMFNGLYWLFVLFVLGFGVVVFVSTFSFGGVKLFSVMSGSMSPKILAGSLVIVKPLPNYKVGDVVTYVPKSEIGVEFPKSTTHRIVEIKESEMGRVFITKGDKNPNNDYNPVTSQQILGKVIFSVPFIGYVASFAKNPIGFILLVIVPAIFIISSEVLKLRTNFKYMLRRGVY